MRHLVDLDSRLVVITWHERPYFPNNEMGEYDNLAIKKYQWKDKLTQDEEEKLERLKSANGKLIPYVEKIEVTELSPQSRNKIKVSFLLTGYELKKINSAIDDLHKQIENPNIIVEDVHSFSEYF